MSATMYLYKVVSGVTYLGHIWDSIKSPEEGDAVLINHGAPTRPDGTLPEVGDKEFKAYCEWLDSWFEEQDLECWTDHKKHTRFSWGEEFGSENRRDVKRTMRRVNTLPFIIDEHNGDKYLVLDEVLYAQGWFLTKRFFRKKFTRVICTTKQELENFFKQYIDYSNKWYDVRGIVESFLNGWEDGMMFECAW